MIRFSTTLVAMVISFTAVTAQINKPSTVKPVPSQPVQQSKPIQQAQPTQQVRPVVTVRPVQQIPQVRAFVITPPVKVSTPPAVVKQQVAPTVIPKAAAIAAGTGISGSSKVSSSAIEDGVKMAMQDANGFSHLFQAKHELEEVVTKLGGKENTLRSVLQEANGKFPEEGEIFKIGAKIEGEMVTIEGKMINGVPRVSTMYIPPIMDEIPPPK